MATPKPKRCECGCGGEPKSKNGRFLPGHDAKLRSKIAEAARTGKKLRIYGKLYEPIEYVKEKSVGLTAIDLSVLEEAYGKSALRGLRNDSDFASRR